MTVITVGNLSGFNFMVADTQVSGNGAPFGKYREIDNTNKIYYQARENCVAGLAGAPDLLHTMSNMNDLSFLNIMESREYRQSVIDFVNDNNSSRHNRPSRLFIMNREEIKIWIIGYSQVDNMYLLELLETADIITIPQDTIHMRCFGYEPPASVINLNGSELTIDNFSERVFERMKQIHKKWRYEEQQEYLVDLKYYSSAYILKNNPVIPHTVIKYYNPT